MASQQSLTIITAFVTDEKLYSPITNDRQYLHVTTSFNNFDSFATSSSKVFAILYNRQVKQPKSMTGAIHKQLRPTKLSGMT